VEQKGESLSSNIAHFGLSSSVPLSIQTQEQEQVYQSADVDTVTLTESEKDALMNLE
jgi:hypothetical protein